MSHYASSIYSALQVVMLLQRGAIKRHAAAAAAALASCDGET